MNSRKTIFTPKKFFTTKKIRYLFFNFFEKKQHTYDEIPKDRLYKNRLVKSVYFTITLVIALTLNTALMSLFHHNIITGYTVNYTIQFVLGLFLIAALFFFPYHPRYYGLNFNRLPFNLITGFSFGLTGLCLISLYRYAMTQQGHPEYSFQFSSSFIIDALIIYPLAVLVQETMTKGFFQSYFVSVFDKIRFNRAISIFLSSVIFAQFHLFYGIHIFIFSFTYGIVSGWYYEQSRSVAGLFIIHYCIGMGLLGGAAVFG